MISNTQMPYNLLTYDWYYEDHGDGPGNRFNILSFSWQLKRIVAIGHPFPALLRPPFHHSTCHIKQFDVQEVFMQQLRFVFILVYMKGPFITASPTRVDIRVAVFQYANLYTVCWFAQTWMQIFGFRLLGGIVRSALLAVNKISFVA